ncbi:MAG: DNA mismatch repair protein MutS [Anaerolineales bacterium]|nr:DNA mismatch repair protein MutS [Anaerolineales bacterium]
MPKETPVRRQYLQIKRQYPQAIVFFRLGDFYETFDKDAEITSSELDLVLTQRQGVPMAGVPYHAAESYISQLVTKGYHIAICEQLGSETVKGLVPRDVVRVVTPGTIVEPEMLAQKRNNYLVSLCAGEEFKRFGLAYADISTGEFSATQIGQTAPGRGGAATPGQLMDELDRLAPSEVVVPASAMENPAWKKILDMFPSISTLPDWRFDAGNARTILMTHFETSTLAGFGCEGLPEAVRAAGAALQYLQEVQKGTVAQIKGLSTYHVSSYMLLDAATRRNLELTESIRSGARQGSLLNVLDNTVTSMGGRMLHRWLNQPLLDISELERRLDHVEALFIDGTLRAELRALLRPLADVERLTNRIMSGNARPRDLVGIRNALKAVEPVRSLLVGIHKDDAAKNLPLPSPLPSILDLLARAVADDPPAVLSKPGVIRPGFSAELDGVQAGASEARNWIANLEKTERKRTGIKNLKVGFNKVFGYYLEITKSNQHLAPENYIRKQTLVNAERYITPELKEYESQVLNAGERQLDIERRLFQQICQQIAAYGQALLQLATVLAHLDVVAGLAEVAALSGYVRPTLVEENTLIVRNGRHPVVERMLQETRFVPNDVAFQDGARIHIITGPNMSGKSVYLRQIALIVLMAQVGSFVPAESAEIGLVDRIFTRVGAQDEVYAGQSTFMVEMVETANILNNATAKSLVVLDEIGRGTSTYDGLSIAWAVVEYLHNHPGLKCKTIFATHYHELTDLAELLPGVSNYNVAVAEQGDSVAFLHRIVPGGADRSYGIHVAQLAGLPSSVTKRAAELLRELELRAPQAVRRPSHLRAEQQMALFPESSPLLKELAELDVTNMTPLDAINKLYEWKRRF